jgi:N-acetylmuramoyl-L-alanine amidase
MTLSKRWTPLCLGLVLLAAPADAYRVLVDAGHGGHDLGAVSPDGLSEKEVALDVARRLGRELEARGFSVSMTRDADVFVPLDERAREASRRGAEFFVSVHANASEAATLRGFEIYYFAPEEDASAVVAARAKEPPPARDSAKFHSPSPAVLAAYWDLRLAESRRQALLAAGEMERSVEGSVFTSVRRLRSAGFRVLKWTECPALLVETGYLTNQDDKRLLQSLLYREQMARALAEGLARYRDSREGKR